MAGKLTVMATTNQVSQVEKKHIPTALEEGSQFRPPEIPLKHLTTEM